MSLQSSASVGTQVAYEYIKSRSNTKLGANWDTAIGGVQNFFRRESFPAFTEFHVCARALEPHSPCLLVNVSPFLGERHRGPGVGARLRLRMYGDQAMSAPQILAKRKL